MTLASTSHARMQVGSRQPERALHFDTSVGTEGAVVWAHTAAENAKDAGTGGIAALSDRDSTTELSRQQTSVLGPVAQDSCSLLGCEEAQLLEVACRELAEPCADVDARANDYGSAAADGPGLLSAETSMCERLKDLILELELDQASRGRLCACQVSQAHGVREKPAADWPVSGWLEVRDPDAGPASLVDAHSGDSETQQALTTRTVLETLRFLDEL